MSDLTVANEILRQLGGNRFTTMTGARNLVGSADSLSFRLPGNITRNRINGVRITLTPSDTYTVTFQRIRSGAIHVVSTHEDVYCDGLAPLFREATGLETRMPVIRSHQG